MERNDRHLLAQDSRFSSDDWFERELPRKRDDNRKSSIQGSSYANKSAESGLQ